MPLEAVSAFGPVDRVILFTWILVGLMLVCGVAGCASDPYPNDRNMKNMSAEQLARELSK